MNFNFSAFKAKVENAKEDVLDAVAERAAELNEQEIARTYAVPEDGWERTGNWRDGQVIESEPERRIVKTVGPATRYEGRVATLNSSRRNPAKANAAQRLESEVDDIAKRVLNDRLG